MAWSEKDPSSVEYFGFSFAEQLPIGVTLTGTPIVYQDTGDSALVVSDPFLAANNTQVLSLFSGGTPKSTYQLRAECAASNGETLEVKATLIVRR